VIQVKRNQPTLFKEIERTTLEQFPLDTYEEQENDHGRQSHWFVNVYNARNSYKAEEWKSLSRFIHVHKQTWIKEKGILREVHSDRYYISDYFQSDAQFYHEGIRGHWTIENSLHWVKDVIIGEDNNQVKSGSGAINRAVCTSIAINIQRKNGQYSISEGHIENNAINVNELFELLNAP
jgi:predicted transposase YbfD/YdcC